MVHDFNTMLELFHETRRIRGHATIRASNKLSCRCLDLDRDSFPVGERSE